MKVGYWPAMKDDVDVRYTVTEVDRFSATEPSPPQEAGDWHLMPQLAMPVVRRDSILVVQVWTRSTHV